MTQMHGKSRFLMGAMGGGTGSTAASILEDEDDIDTVLILMPIRSTDLMKRIKASCSGSQQPGGLSEPEAQYYSAFSSLVCRVSLISCHFSAHLRPNPQRRRRCSVWKRCTRWASRT